MTTQLTCGKFQSPRCGRWCSRGAESEFTDHAVSVSKPSVRAMVLAKSLSPSTPTASPRFKALGAGDGAREPVTSCSSASARSGFKALGAGDGARERVHQGLPRQTPRGFKALGAGDGVRETGLHKIGVRTGLQTQNAETSRHQTSVIHFRFSNEVAVLRISRSLKTFRNSPQRTRRTPHLYRHRGDHLTAGRVSPDPARMPDRRVSFICSVLPRARVPAPKRCARLFLPRPGIDRGSPRYCIVRNQPSESTRRTACAERGRPDIALQNTQSIKQ
jgi:hypothetical protein